MKPTQFLFAVRNQAGGALFWGTLAECRAFKAQYPHYAVMSAR